MSSRNILKIDIPDSFYHVYARGASKGNVYLEPDDYRYFLALFPRYLSPVVAKNSAGVPYQKLHEDLDLLCYCLMPNHFHLLLFQRKAGAMERLMRGVMTSYSKYFNTKYSRSGSLFESRYKASRISNQGYLEHITRYIHLNPKAWRDYPYSSLRNYVNENDADWLKPDAILDLFDSTTQYEIFVSDHQEAQRELELIKHELANNDPPY